MADTPEQVRGQPGEPPAPATTGRRFFGVVGRLTSINAMVRGFALITGPLMARALGPEGRGEVAAILVSFTMASLIAMLGFPPYASRQVARGASPGTIVGSVGAVLLLTGGVVAVLSVPIADFLAEDRETVRTFLIIGLALMPLALVGQLLIGVTIGLEQWRRVEVARLIPPVFGLVGVVGLYIADALTVATAATVTIVSSLAQITPGLTLMIRRRYRLRVRRRVIREGTSFGIKAWANQLTTAANARLDQLLMVRMVPSSELGLYAVGANAATVAPLFTTALVVPLSVRVARGEARIVARAVRSAIALSAGIAVVLALLIPLVLPLLFGSDFSDASVMAQILLLGSIPSAGRAVLISALTAAGRPGAGAIAQIIGLAVTVPALLIVLPPWGGVGAAAVSSVVSVVIFVAALPIGVRHFGLGYRELLLIRHHDIRWALDQVPILHRRRGRRDPDA